VKIGEIQQLLKKFGLTEYESKAYASLLLLGPSRAGALSSESKVPQSKIYNVLEDLMAKQLVEVFEGRPKEYRAVEPKSGLKNLADDMDQRVKFLRTKINDVNSFLKPQQEKEILEGVWTQKGERWIEFFNRLADMFDKSQRYVFAITRDFTYTSRLREAVKRCKHRGVKLYIMGMGSINDANYYKAKWYNAHGIPLKIFETKIHPRILVIDGKEVSIRLDNSYEPSKKRFHFHSIWSADPSLVQVIDSYMKNLWSIAQPVDFKKIPAPVAVPPQSI